MTAPVITVDKHLRKYFSLFERHRGDITGFPQHIIKGTVFFMWGILLPIPEDCIVAEYPSLPDIASFTTPAMDMPATETGAVKPPVRPLLGPTFLIPNARRVRSWRRRMASCWLGQRETSDSESSVPWILSLCLVTGNSTRLYKFNTK